ncbi:MAG: CopG family antitoxin [Ahrensia sp.]|nr:CopG family antitoxin [Ahrensia sp.]
MKNKEKLKPLPLHTTDEEAEHFLDTADLSEYDLSGFKPAHLKFARPMVTFEIGLSPEQVEALDMIASRDGTDRERVARRFIEEGVSASVSKEEA